MHPPQTPEIRQRLFERARSDAVREIAARSLDLRGRHITPAPAQFVIEELESVRIGIVQNIEQHRPLAASPCKSSRGEDIHKPVHAGTNRMMQSSRGLECDAT